MGQEYKEQGPGNDWKSSLRVTFFLASAAINTAAYEISDKYRREAISTSNWNKNKFLVESEFDNIEQGSYQTSVKEGYLINSKWDKLIIAKLNDAMIAHDVRTDSPSQHLNATAIGSEAHITSNIRSVLFYEDLVREYKDLLKQKFLDDAVFLLLERIDGELSRENFNWVEDLLSKFLGENLGIESLIATLSITHDAKEYLPTRKIFYESVKDYLGTVRTESEVAGLLHGLG